MDKARIKESLEKAHDEAISAAFKVLIGNLIESKRPGSEIKETDAIGYFARSMKFTQLAFDKANEIVDQSQPASREKTGSV